MEADAKNADSRASSLAHDGSRLTSLAQTRPARIVLLDDEVFVRDAMKALFEFWFADYSITECLNGDECLAEVAQDQPDLLITDYGHPGAKLEQMLSEFSNHGYSFPVIVSSAFVGAYPDLQRRLASSPAFLVEFVHKPMLAQDLKAAIVKCLKTG